MNRCNIDCDYFSVAMCSFGICLCLQASTRCEVGCTFQLIQRNHAITMRRYVQSIRARNETGTLNPVDDADDFGVLPSSSRGTVTHAPHAAPRRDHSPFQHGQKPTLATHHHRRGQLHGPGTTEEARDQDEHDGEFVAILEQMQSLAVSEQQVNVW